MARVNASATNSAEVALSAATVRTVVGIRNVSNHRAAVTGWGIYFDGTSSTAEPIVVDIYCASSNGTSTSITAANCKVNQGDPETIQTTAYEAFTSTEPTTAKVLKSVEVHPQSGYEWTAPYGQEYHCGGASSDAQRIYIRATAPASVNCKAYISWEE